MKKLTCLPAGKILPIAILISLIFFAGSVNAQNYEVCKEKMQSIQDKCDKSFEECNNPCKSLTGTAWGPCYSACSRTSYDCYQKSVSPYNECLEKEINCEEDGKITGSKDCEKVQDRKGESSAKQSNSNKNGNPFNIFAFNPLETWRNIQGLLDIEEGFPSLLQSSQFLTESAEVPVEIPRPSIAFDPEGKPWDFLPGFIPHESIYLGNTMRISEGTKVSAGGVNQGIDKKLLNLEEGEVEVIKNEPDVTDSEYDGIKTPNATVLSIQTHYWVSYDKKKNQTAVAVYEGKVEVKSNDGKATIVSPNGDPSTGSGQVKPGVVVVTQKLSPIKLVIAGLVLAAVIGGVALILKRKFTAKMSNKKKK